MSAVAKAAVLSTGLTVALATAATIVVVLHPGASPQSVASPAASTITLIAVGDVDDCTGAFAPTGQPATFAAHHDCGGAVVATLDGGDRLLLDVGTDTLAYAVAATHDDPSRAPTATASDVTLIVFDDESRLVVLLSPVR